MEICRLCLLNQQQHISVFSKLESNRDVANIISRHVGEVSETDPLPKHVCLDCWKLCDNFHEFHERVHVAQAEYLKKLIKSERENHFIEIPTVHLNADATLVSEQFDGLHETNGLAHEPTIKLEYEVCKNVPLSPPLISIEVPEEMNDDISIRSGDDDDEGDENDALDYDNYELNSSYAQSEDDENESGSEEEEYSDKTSETQATRTKYSYKRQFICDFCGLNLSSKQRLLEHLLRHVKYKCQICSERCISRRSLETHNKVNHSADAAQKARKQLEELKPILGQIPNDEQIADTLAKYSDPLCDHCKEPLIGASLDEAILHYKQKHNSCGYIKCCEITLKTVDDISRHVLTHLFPEHFVCSVCSKTGKRSDKFSTHLSKHLIDIQKYPFMCMTCERGFARDDLLEVHMRYYHKNDAKRDHTADGESIDSRLADFFTMRCDICTDTQFSSFQHAKLHYKSVHGVTGYLVCCNKKFVKAKTVDNHLQWHINPELNKCPICGKCFKQKITLHTHVAKHKAKSEKRFKCQECGKAFFSNYYVKLHMKVHDLSIKKSLACPQCEKRYTSTKSLENHILFVHKKEPKAGDMCEFCGKRFISRTSVINHIQTVHRAEAGSGNQINPGTRSHCNICSASFINKYRLKKHIETIHLGKPVKCTQCDKVAPNESALICHMRSVHVAHSHQCHLCAKSFKAAVALKDHIATHTGEKTYKCSFCPEAFIWRPNMYSHQKKAHPDEWKILKTQERKRKN